MKPNLDPGEHDLLTSPLGQRGVARVFFVGGPAALLVIIVVSLWVSFLHVRHTSVVQVETEWLVGERLGVRARLVPEAAGPLRDTRGRIWVSQGDTEYPAVTLNPTGRDGVVQSAFDVPGLSLGAAELHVELSAEGAQTKSEVVPVTVVAHRAARRGAATLAQSNLQLGDDSDPEPPGMRISIRPAGRLVSDFDNVLFVRVLNVDGRPYEGPIEVALAGGEFMGKHGDFDNPPVLVRTQTDTLGLAVLEGLLTSEVLRLETRVMERTDQARVRMKRRQRFVSYAGAVELDVSANHVLRAASLEVGAAGLLARRPIFVDVHAADGAWIDTLSPPFSGPLVVRLWQHPGLMPGVVQFEAYNSTSAPGESTAVARVQVVDEDPGSPASLLPLIELQRGMLDDAKIEKGFDKELEQAYLDWLAGAQLRGDDTERARSFLLGTLTLEVHGPPTALETRDREISTLAAKQRRWTIGVRIALLGGGGLFLAAMTLVMVRSHSRAAEATLRELERGGDAEARDTAAQAIRTARRQALLRGLGVIAVMAGALVLTAVMLESFLWVF